MPTHHPRQPSAAAGVRPGLDEAEAILVEHYPRLVRLAHLTLPPALGRHRRVLAAHAVVQRALPRGGRGSGGTAAREDSGPGYRWLRRRVLRAALRYGRRRPAGLPVVLGLRLFPSAGGAEEAALDRALAPAAGPARAAFALTVLEGLGDAEAAGLLAVCGVRDPEAAVRAAGVLREQAGARAETLLRSGEFDPCAVQTRPTDLLRRRSRARLGSAMAVLAVLGGALAAAGPAVREAERTVTAGPPGSAALARAAEPALLERAPDLAWADTSRVDFTVWPARGSRTGDRRLLGRALRTWAGGGEAVRVSAADGTPRTPPARPPRLLYAGEADGAAVVLLHGDGRVVRYAEPLAAGGGAVALDFARTDGAGVTTAAAVVVSRTPRGVRYLLAPWIAETAVRDLSAPGVAARPLTVSDEGVTDPVPVPAAGGPCASPPVLQLRSSERIVERHTFLVADLGDLAPAHLTHTPPPGSGAPARQPREAVAGPAPADWAHGVCLLGGLRGAGVRAVNHWTFAEQRLPDGGGVARWVCVRADTWRGPGRVLVQFRPPGTAGGAPETVVARAADTAACGRFGRHVLAGARWRSPAGDWYLVAAGSRAVSRITVRGGAVAESRGPLLAVAADPAARVTLSAGISGGGTLAPVGAESGSP
jgi:DNA-directed RNA polymerase specialized sigma24 family protein